MNALLHFGFLQRALVAGVLIAVACAVLGVFLVLRKDAMIGHGLSHVAFGGVALGLFLNMLPLGTALVVSVAAALGIMRLKAKAGLHGDTAIGIFSSLGMAVGILLATLSGKFNVDLLSYLFGEILAIEPLEVWLSLALAFLVIAAVYLNYQQLLFMTFDRDSALVSGVRINRLETLLTVLTAVTIVLGMKVVGILLVAALIVIPAAAGLQAARSFRTAVIVSSAVSVVSTVGGLILALSFDVPASAAIVILCFLIFSGIYIAGRKRKLFPG
ncbi:MAG: metal ABC transporter permease [Candidatus Aminicenantales bacterium]